MSLRKHDDRRYRFIHSRATKISKSTSVALYAEFVVRDLETLKDRYPVYPNTGFQRKRNRELQAIVRIVTADRIL